MKFQQYDLGQLNKGETVEITLEGNAANVKLMNPSNFQSYKNDRDHKYYGGYITQSPYRIFVPYSGHWIITIDLGGYAGNVSSVVRVI
ncbi:MAG: DUF1883 domain-containing protein [Fluviicola sp.]